uniref:Large ribosomal subunit protein uL6c n=1 Tax=Rhodymenia pseudopalmata TaxID=31502 RepID=A0A1C9C7U9_RHOPU|nr:ribosomal protein L6 [Rhodymenia pseudopalmata]AOM64465.1 ribosomal protein L6 [Rhodymenia pseudopalmata]
MSRIGKKNIIIPQNVNANIDSSNIIIKGPKGQLAYKLPCGITIEKNKNILQLKKVDESKEVKALHGLSRTMVNNMVIGVSEGFDKKLEIQGVGYRSQVKGKTLILNVGYSHTVSINPPEGISVSVENSTLITVHGADKAIVGEIAAKIRAVRKPEPYKGKGIRYIEEKVRRKIGKAGK